MEILRKAMRGVFSSFFLLCLLGTVRVEAQKDTSSPSKADAVSFIQKLYREYGIKNYSTYGYTNTEDSITMWLDSCRLNIVHKVVSVTQDINRFRFIKTVTTNIIDLSLIRLDDGRIEALETNGIVRQSLSYHKDREKQEFKLSHQEAKESINDLPISILVDVVLPSPGENTSYDAHNYDERLNKAFDFLIKAFGGGTIKTDPNDKF